MFLCVKHVFLDFGTYNYLVFSTDFEKKNTVSSYVPFLAANHRFGDVTKMLTCRFPLRVETLKLL